MFISVSVSQMIGCRATKVFNMVESRVAADLVKPYIHSPTRHAACI